MDDCGRELDMLSFVLGRRLHGGPGSEVYEKSLAGQVATLSGHIGLNLISKATSLLLMVVRIGSAEIAAAYFSFPALSTLVFNYTGTVRGGMTIFAYAALYGCRDVFAVVFATARSANPMQDCRLLLPPCDYTSPLSFMMRPLDGDNETAESERVANLSLFLEHYPDELPLLIGNRTPFSSCASMFAQHRRWNGSEMRRAWVATVVRYASSLPE